MIEAGLIFLSVLAFVPATAMWSANREPSALEWGLALFCATLSAAALLIARRLREVEVVTMIELKLGVEGEWRTAWEVETGRLPRTPIAAVLVGRAPFGVTRRDLRDVVPPAALPLLALPFLAAGLYAFSLDRVREDRRSEFELSSVARGLNPEAMRAALTPSGGAEEDSEGSPMSDPLSDSQTNELFQEAIRSGAELEREVGAEHVDPESLLTALDQSEKALESFEKAAKEGGELAPEVEAALAERRAMLDAARLQLAGAEPEREFVEEPEVENGASPSLAEASPGTMTGQTGGDTNSGATSRGSSGSAGVPPERMRSGEKSERRAVPPVLPGRIFEARYDGVVARFMQSMKRSAD